jgi:hypothetical protein
VDDGVEGEVVEEGATVVGFERRVAVVDPEVLAAIDEILLICIIASLRASVVAPQTVLRQLDPFL